MAKAGPQPLTEAPPSIVDVAERVEKHRRHSEARMILVVVFAVLLGGILLGSFLVWEMRQLIERVEKQNEAQLLAIEEARAAAVADAAAQRIILERQEEILTRIQEKSATQADVGALEDQVAFLRAEGRKLRSAILTLIGILEGVGVASPSGSG